MGLETAIAVGIIGAGIAGGVMTAKNQQSEGKSAEELRQKAIEKAREDAVRRGQNRERNKTIYTSPLGAGEGKSKLGG